MAADAAEDTGEAYFVFLITEGSKPDNNTLNQMIERVQNTPEISMSTIGVGKDVDRTMLLALANAGRGYCEFLDYERNEEKIKQKVQSCMNGMLTPYLRGLMITWVVNGQNVNQRKIGRVYKNQLVRHGCIIDKNEFNSLEVVFSYDNN